MEGDRSFSLLGDRAVVITLGDTIDSLTHVAVARLFKHLTNDPITGVVELVPTYNALTVYYDPLKLALQHGERPFDHVCARLKERMAQLVSSEGNREERVSKVVNGNDHKMSLDVDDGEHVVTIPVCYDERLAPDLSYVANYHQTSIDNIIRLHSEGEYIVSMIGFMPGFPYLSGLSHQLATPRHDRPRPRVVAGSVGIAGLQTGIYPFTSPGGWQIIGRTPLTLFDSTRTVPSVLAFGDRVCFEPITWDEFNGWGR